MGKDALASRHTPDQGRLSLLPQRLGLAALYADTLPVPLRNAMGALALRLDPVPQRAAILRGEAGVDLNDSSDGYRLAAQYQRDPSPELLPELRAEAYQGLLRISVPLFLVLGLILSASLRLWTDDSEDPASPEDAPGRRVDPWLALAFFTTWQLFSWGPLGALVAPLLPQGLLGALGTQSVSYLLLAILFVAVARRTGWRPWSRVGWGWVARGFLLCLLLMTVVDLLIWGATGTDPFNRDPVLGILAAAPSSQYPILVFWIVVIGPAFEELLFRGFLLNSFLAAWGERRALTATATIFALAHGNLWGLPSLFVGGLVLGWVALRSGSCTSSMVLHGLWNFTWLCHVAMVLPGDLW